MVEHLGLLDVSAEPLDGDPLPGGEELREVVDLLLAARGGKVLPGGVATRGALPGHVRVWRWVREDRTSAAASAPPRR